MIERVSVRGLRPDDDLGGRARAVLHGRERFHRRHSLDVPLLELGGQLLVGAGADGRAERVGIVGREGVRELLHDGRRIDTAGRDVDRPDRRRLRPLEQGRAEGGATRQRAAASSRSCQGATGARRRRGGGACASRRRHRRPAPRRHRRSRPACPRGSPPRPRRRGRPSRRRSVRSRSPQRWPGRRASPRRPGWPHRPRAPRRRPRRHPACLGPGRGDGRGVRGARGSGAPAAARPAGSGSRSSLIPARSNSVAAGRRPGRSP